MLNRLAAGTLTLLLPSLAFAQASLPPPPVKDTPTDATRAVNRNFVDGEFAKRGRYSVKSQPFGAKGDGLRREGCATTAGSAVLTCPRAAFTAGDVGKTVILKRAGASGGQMISTITARTSATTVTMAANASTTVANTNNTGTSTSSVAIGTGTKTFTASTGRAWVANNIVQVAPTSNTGAWMWGRVTSYNAGNGSLSISVLGISGSGTFASWNISSLPVQALYGTDDGAAIKEAAAQVTSTGGELHFPSGIYLTSQRADFAATRFGVDDQSAFLFASQLDHPPGLKTVRITGASRPQIVATAAMASIFRFTYSNEVDSETSNLTPFAASIEGVVLEGNEIATSCLTLNWTRETVVRHAAFSGCASGVLMSGGYGGNRIEYSNFIGCLYCVDVDNTGDHTIINNTIFPGMSSGGTAMAMRGRGLVGGNTRFQNNTVSTSDNTYFAVYSAIYGVSIEAGVNTSYDHRDYKIVGNEFHGLTAGVLASGYSAANPTVKKLLIAHNHDIVSASGASYPGTLASLTNVQGVTIEGNVVGQPGLLTTATAVSLSGVTHAVLRGNLVMNTNVTAYGISDSNQISISDTFRDVGKGSTGNQAILLWNSQNVSVVGSSAVQTGSYAATFLQEAGGSDFNAANANFVRGFTTKYMPAGANTTFGTLN